MCLCIKLWWTMINIFHPVLIKGCIWLSNKWQSSLVVVKWFKSRTGGPILISCPQHVTNRNPSSCCPWSTHTYGGVCGRLSCSWLPAKCKVLTTIACHTQKHLITSHLSVGAGKLKYGLYFCNNWGHLSGQLPDSRIQGVLDKTLSLGRFFFFKSSDWLYQAWLYELVSARWQIGV